MTVPYTLKAGRWLLQCTGIRAARHANPHSVAELPNEPRCEGVRLWNDHEEVFRWLRRYKDNSTFVTTLRQWLHDEDDWTAFRYHEDETLRRAAHQIVLGRIEVCEIAVEHDTVGRSGGGEAEEPEPLVIGDFEPTAPPPVAPSEKETNYLEIVLVDDESGEPMAGVTCQLKLPDGSSSKKTTDSQGRIHIDGVPGGTFDIEDISDDALEVVTVE